MRELGRAIYLAAAYDDYYRINMWLRGKARTRKGFHRTMCEHFPRSWEWLR